MGMRRKGTAGVRRGEVGCKEGWVGRDGMALAEREANLRESLCVKNVILTCEKLQ